MGGSQGASGINQAMIKALPGLQRQATAGDPSLWQRATSVLLADNYQRENIPRLRRGISSSDGGSLQRGGFRDRPVGRGQSRGARGLFALPSLLIPFPYAADDHQTRNAEIFAQRRSRDSCCKETELSGDLLGQENSRVLGDPAKLCSDVGKLRPRSRRKTRPISWSKRWKGIATPHDASPPDLAASF